MLLGVLHVHALIAALKYLGDSPLGHAAHLQVKVLAPHVVVFFAMAGMSSRSLGSKPWPVVFQRSLMLVLLAWLAHVVGVLLQHMVWSPWPPAFDLLKRLVKPLVVGVTHSTFVLWFLVVLAVTRLFVYAWARGWRWFFVSVSIAGGAAAVAHGVGLSDNFYDWKHWPAAFVMFLVGIRLSHCYRVPHWIGLIGVAGALALPLVNRPVFWGGGVCVNCTVGFIARPMVGEFGFLPLYVVQEALALIALLWATMLAAASPLRRFLAYIGRNAIPLLVLHGWVILSFYGLAYWLVSRAAGPWLFVAVFLINTAVHLLLLRLFAAPLGRFIGWCSIASHRVVKATCALRRVRTHWPLPR